MAVSVYFYWHDVGSSRGANSSDGKEIHIYEHESTAGNPINKEHKKNNQEDCDVTFYDARLVRSKICFSWSPRGWILSIAPLNKLDGFGGTK